MMGRGNACVHGEYETLFYIDYDNFICYVCDEDGNETEERDYDIESSDVDESIKQLKTSIKNKTNMADCDYWISRDAHAILENKLFMIAIEDNEWSYAVKLLQKEEPSIYEHYSIKGLQK